MIELVIDAQRHDLGGFTVGRVLPFARHRMVGPFAFFDHMGPVEMPAGVPRSADVRTHPHIGLATVTYLFKGEMRAPATASGSIQPIRPAEVNLMTAGRGITHSERFDGPLRDHGGTMHGHPGLGRPARGAGGDGARRSRTTPATPTCPSTRRRHEGAADRRRGLRAPRRR